MLARWLCKRRNLQPLRKKTLATGNRVTSSQVKVWNQMPNTNLEGTPQLHSNYSNQNMIQKYPKHSSETVHIIPYPLFSCNPELPASSLQHKPHTSFNHATFASSLSPSFPHPEKQLLPHLHAMPLAASVDPRHPTTPKLNARKVSRLPRTPRHDQLPNERVGNLRCCRVSRVGVGLDEGQGVSGFQGDHRITKPSLCYRC